MSIILQSNLDKKLPQKIYANQPVIVKEILSDKTRQGQDLIKALIQSFSNSSFFLVTNELA